MNIVTVEGKEYDLDSVAEPAREQIQKLMFLSSDLAKMLVPPDEIPAKLEAARKALAQALAAA